MTQEEYNIRHSYEIAVRNLNARGWEIMYPNEKLDALQAIENKNAMEQGRLACEVRAEPMEPGNWGYQNGLEIVVNSNELQNPDFLEHVDTIFHEGSHARDWQGTFLPGVRAQYDPQELAARNSPIPDPDVDFKGYQAHPAEVAARQAGTQGVTQVLEDQEQIRAYDEEHNRGGNQILTTYDDLALSETPAEEPDLDEGPDEDRM